MSPVDQGQPMAQQRSESPHVERFIPAPMQASQRRSRSPPIKRRRPEENHPPETIGSLKPERSGSSLGDRSFVEPEVGEEQRNVLPFTWEEDPWVVDSELTHQYVDSYFTDSGDGPYTIFPRTVFTRWLVKENSIVEEERLVVYAVLAVGASVSSQPHSDVHKTELVTIANKGWKMLSDRSSIYAALAEILLALCCSQSGDHKCASKHATSALNTVTGLKYNMEDECNKINTDLEGCFGLSKQGLVECRRRTFWSAYMLDVSVLEISSSWRASANGCTHPAILPLLWWSPTHAIKRRCLT